MLSGAAAARRRLRDAGWAVTPVKHAPEGAERPLTAPLWPPERLDSVAIMHASLVEAVELRSLACSPWRRVACEAGGYGWAACSGAHAALRLKSWALELGLGAAAASAPSMRPSVAAPAGSAATTMRRMHAARSPLLWPMQHGQGTLHHPLVAWLPGCPPSFVLAACAGLQLRWSARMAGVCSLAPLQESWCCRGTPETS